MTDRASDPILIGVHRCPSVAICWHFSPWRFGVLAFISSPALKPARRNRKLPNMNSFLQGNTCVFGLQWGDEGKGKIVDFLTEHAEVVVRYCGGANAGHSVKI